MATVHRFKCLNCHKLFRPDPRNRRHQKYCSQPECRAASKVASQQHWLVLSIGGAWKTNSKADEPKRLMLSIPRKHGDPLLFYLSAFVRTDVAPTTFKPPPRPCLYFPFQITCLSAS